MIRPPHLQTWFSGQELPERPQPFAIITAHNPISQERGWSLNGRADEALWECLTQSGHDPRRVVAGSADGSHFEESWTVHCIELEDARRLGRELRQDSIFWVEDGTVFVQGCETGARERLGKWEERCIRFNNPGSSHCLYVIELDAGVWQRSRFAEDNAGADRTKPCYYVGMTGLTPVERYLRHRAGYKACALVRDFGAGIAWDRLDHLARMGYAEAVDLEPRLARSLREAGHGVWQK